MLVFGCLIVFEGFQGHEPKWKNGACVLVSDIGFYMKFKTENINDYSSKLTLLASLRPLIFEI